MSHRTTIAAAAIPLRRRALGAALGLACALGACLAFAAAPAAATVLHNSEGSFTTSETPATAASGYLLATAVDNSTGANAGDVYIGGLSFSGAGAYVYRFTADGRYTGVELKGSETPDGSFGFLDFSNFATSRGLAVVGSTGADEGDVYVADATHDVIDRFGANGKFLCEITGQAPTPGDVTEEEEFERHECAGKGGSKTAQDGFHVGPGSSLGVAVDPQNGDVYVSSPADQAIDEFNEEGEYIGQITGAQITDPGALAFDSSGELYVTNASLAVGENVVKLDAKGKFISVLDEDSPGYVAVNPASGRVYVFEGGEDRVAEYDAAGTLISTFGSEAKMQFGSVAANGETGRVYFGGLVKNAPTVDMFSKAIVLPSLTTGGATEVKEESATLHGEAEPDVAHGGGGVESCEFEYASSQTLDRVQTVSIVEKLGEHFTFSISGTGWSGDGKVSSESTVITEVLSAGGTPVPGEGISGAGIAPGTTIVYYAADERKIVLSQPTGTITAAEEEGSQRFATAFAQSTSAKTIQKALEAGSAGSGNVVVSGPAGGPWTVEFTGALASVTMPPLGIEATGFATVSVELNWASASKAACEPAAPYSASTSVSARLDGLTPSAPYNYRLRAADSEGSADGENRHLTTTGPPSVDRIAAEARPTTVTFWAKVNPFGSDTTCRVQYVSDADYEASQWTNPTTVPCEAGHLGSGSNDLGAAVDGTEFPYPNDTIAMAQAGEHGELERGTGYRYRFLAESKAGTSVREGSFETWGIRKFSVQMLEGAHETGTLSGATTMLWEPGLPESPLQAGAHPYEMVTTIDFSLSDVVHRCEYSYDCRGGRYGEEIVQSGETMTAVKDVKVALPPGLIGNPDNIPKCNFHVAKEHKCPTASQVGILEYVTDNPLTQVDGSVKGTAEEYLAGGCNIYCLAPIYNLEPQHANPAEFGNPGDVTHVSLPFEVRAGTDYGVNDDSVNITAAAPVSELRIRIWGVPANSGHAVGRGFGNCPNISNTKCSAEGAEAPLLRNPTSCEGPQTVNASFDTWSDPGLYISKAAEMPAVTGCGKLKFEPSIEAQPTSIAADSASGMGVDLKVPQNEEANTLDTPDLKDATITFPAGMTVNPSAADGRAACSEQQVGFTGFTELQPRFEPGVETAQFTPGPAECPNASKLGSVQIDTQLVEHPIKGGLYLATPHSNPFGSLIAVYLAAYDPITGVVVKLPGKVNLDPVTGQITTTFEQNPQLPFEELKVNLFGGSRAPFTTPLQCGSYSLSSDLTPWSAPEGKDAFPSSGPFGVTGSSGGPCVKSEGEAPNAPVFQAGTASPVAGSYSPFVLKLEREDGSQHFGSLDVTLPPGLIGKVAGVEKCSQADIEAAERLGAEGDGAIERAHPSCPAGSEVGVVHVGVGSGAPFNVTGHVYFAGPYRGAPFSLAVITPAIAGPFDLGTVVVRAGLYINQQTAQVTVESDPFPTILDGIPLDIRSVGVEMTRKDFTLNPTSCSVMNVTGSETSTTGQTAALSDRFQAGGCDTMPFHPSFAAETRAHHTRKSGSYLEVTIAAKEGEANLAKVHVTLPKKLPVELNTLKQSCSEAQFDANPTGCPKASFVGAVTVHTPVLAEPLRGPAIYVSHGGAKLPDLALVLQGEGVTIVQEGSTKISKGLTSSSFEAIPDVPVSSIELVLPEGEKPALGGNGGNFCDGPLYMPTTITGQNGAVVQQRTVVAVAGCPSTHGGGKLSVLSHEVHGSHVELRVAVPAAGKLVASGKGVERAARKVARASIKTIAVTLTAHQRQLLAQPHRSRKIAVHLRFKPKAGQAQSVRVMVSVG